MPSLQIAVVQRLFTIVQFRRIVAQCHYNLCRLMTSVNVDIKLTARVIGIAATLVIVFSIIATLLKASGARHPEYLLGALNLDYELTLPAWFTSKLLFIAALLLCTIAVTNRTRRFQKRWWFLALVFMTLSVDEHIALHEHLGARLHGMVMKSGAFAFGAWVAGAIPVLAVMVIAYWRFVEALPPTIRLFSISAAACYVMGAVGMEMVAGWWVEYHGTGNMLFAILVCIEETLEITGVCLWIHALSLYLVELDCSLRFVRAKAAHSGS